METHPHIFIAADTEAVLGKISAALAEQPRADALFSALAARADDHGCVSPGVLLTAMSQEAGLRLAEHEAVALARAFQSRLAGATIGVPIHMLRSAVC
jgi:hypothetical protein